MPTLEVLLGNMLVLQQATMHRYYAVNRDIDIVINGDAGMRDLDHRI